MPLSPEEKKKRKADKKAQKLREAEEMRITLRKVKIYSIKLFDVL